MCSAFCEHRLVCGPPCVCVVFYVEYGSLRSMRGTHPAPPLGNKTPLVATNRLLCAAPSVRTSLYVHRLVHAMPCIWTAAHFARCGGHPCTTPQITRLLPWPKTAFCVQRLLSAPPCMCIDLCMCCLVCGLRLTSLDARDTPASPLNNKTSAVATDRLLYAAPFVSTALYVHRLVHVLPCMWSTARFARYGGRPRTPPKLQHSGAGHGLSFVCSAFCEHRLVCAPPCSCAALYVDYGSLRSMRGTPPHSPQITRLLWWPRTAFCVQRLL